MRIVDCGFSPGLSDTRCVSQAGTLAPTHAHAANVMLPRTGAGGCAATHRAVGHQVLTVIADGVRVQGADAARTVIGAGRTAISGPGEQHRTVAATDMTVVVSEGPDQRVLP